MKRVYLVASGPFSECYFIAANSELEVRMTLPKGERECALVTETDMDPTDLAFIEKTQLIVKRLENEVTEAKMNLADRMNRRKRGA
jgi:hypothetical protein